MQKDKERYVLSVGFLFPDLTPTCVKSSLSIMFNGVILEFNWHLQCHFHTVLYINNQVLS